MLNINVANFYAVNIMIDVIKRDVVNIELDVLNNNINV